jgi:glycosyltransferase involved in cell wall biosynthesis
MTVPVTVIIPTMNEALNLERCLKSISWASEIYVVDSASTDDTCRIAAAYGVKIVQFRYSGGWPKKKNWALANLRFANEWVLLLDADEVLPECGRKEIAGAVQAPGEIAGYWINRRFMFLGKWLKHAYYPNWNLRLFKHAQGRFERLVEGETNSGDVEIHEHVVVNGLTRRLKTELEHYAFPSVECFIDKHNRYSNWEAQYQLEMDQANPTVRLQDNRANLRRGLRRLSRKLPMRPALRFLYVFILQRGFLDGIEGYYFARLHACYEWMSVIKTYERKHHANHCLGN